MRSRAATRDVAVADLRDARRRRLRARARLRALGDPQRAAACARARPISGQRALSRRALEDVLPFADGFGMEIGMTIDAVRAGHRLVEIELDLDHRASGRTLAGFVHRGRQLLRLRARLQRACARASAARAVARA